MNDHDLIEPDFDLMHNAIMEHYNRHKRRKHQHVTTSQPTSIQSPSRRDETQDDCCDDDNDDDVDVDRDVKSESRSSQKSQKQLQSQQHNQQHQYHQLRQNQQQPSHLQESTRSNPTTPSHRPTGSPGDEDGLSPFINNEHLQNEFQEVYANIHTERLSSMSKNQLVNQYLLLEERVEELENQLRETQTSANLEIETQINHLV